MGRNVEALEHTIDALEGLDREGEHAALIEHARTLAQQLDYDLPDTKIHGEYHKVLTKLLELGKKQDVDAFEQLLAEIRGDA